MNNYENDISYIVNKFMECSDRTLPKTKGNNIESIKDVNYIDYNREFKDIMTEFVVNEFYPLDKDNAHFIQTIVNCFETMIKKYIEIRNLEENDIIFLYKGGNVLRVLALESIREQPGEIAEKLINNYYKYFKKSDADFTIYINPKYEETFDNIKSDISILSFIILNYIRAILLSGDYFLYLRYNENYKEEILSKYLKILQETNSIKDEENKNYNLKFKSLILNDTLVGEKIKNLKMSSMEGGFINDDVDVQEFNNNINNFDNKINSNREDFMVVNNQNNPSTTIQYPITIKKIFKKYGLKKDEQGKKIYKFMKSILNSDKESYVYVMLNNTLDFAKSKFNLLRSKVNFTAIVENSNGELLKKNINGELIDVSIIDRKTLLLEGQSIHENLEKNIKTYNISNEKYNLTFKSYSMSNLMHDLIFIVFENNEFPWDDRKYEKRLARLIFLYLIEMLKQKYGLNIKDRIEFVRILKSSLSSIYRLIEENNFGEINIKINQFTESILTYNYQLKEIIFFIKDILQKSNNSNEFNKNFIKLIQNIINNLELMDDFLASLNNYIQKDGLIEESNIYDAKQLGGNNFYNKYLKYKNKYINNKI
jgi:hypothetical protein